MAVFVVAGVFAGAASGAPPMYNIIKVPYASGYTQKYYSFKGTITNDGTIYTHQHLIGKPRYRPFKYSKNLVPEELIAPSTSTQWTAYGFSRSGKNFIWMPRSDASLSNETSTYLSVDGKVFIPPMPKWQNYTIDRVKFTQINDDGIAVGVAELDYFGTVRWGVRYDTRTGEYQLGRNESGHVDELYWSINNAGQILSGANGWIFTGNDTFLHRTDGTIQQLPGGIPQRFLLTEQGNYLFQNYNGGVRLKPSIWTNGVTRELKTDPRFPAADALFTASSDNGSFIGSFDGGVTNRFFVGMGDTMYNLSDYLMTTGEMANFKVSQVLSINRSGQILCVGDQSSTVGGYYLLQPVPEPGTWLAVGAGLVILSRRRRSG